MFLSLTLDLSLVVGAYSKSQDGYLQARGALDSTLNHPTRLPYLHCLRLLSHALLPLCVWQRQMYIFLALRTSHHITSKGIDKVLRSN